MIELKGLLLAITTPFKDDLSLDVEGFGRLVEQSIDDGMQGLVVAGCTGEPWALNETERKSLFEIAVKRNKGRVPIVGGASGIDAKEAIARVRLAEAAGCDAVMVHAPWYVVPGPEELFDYFKEVVDASKLPVMIYNIPRRLGVGLSVDLVDRLADEEKVVALKESSKDWMVLSEMIRRCKDRMNVLVGYADTLGLGGIAEGSAGTVDAVFPALMGRTYRKFIDAALAGDMATARPLQADFAKWHREMWGIGTFPAALKAAINMIGRAGGRPRPPLRPLNAQQSEQVRKVLTNMGLLSAGAARRAG